MSTFNMEKVARPEVAGKPSPASVVAASLMAVMS
jgi:hypothetical protein